MYKQETLKQHYVSWFYLKNWISESEKCQKGIWAKRDTDPPFFAQGRNKLAQIDRFYRISVDQGILDMMRCKYPSEHSAGYLQKLLQELPVMASITEYISQKARCHQRLESINTNFLENKYGELEGYVSRDLAKLLKGRWPQILRTSSAISSLYDSLLCLYATQLFRSASMRNLMSQQVSSFTLEHDGGTTVLSPAQKDTLLKLIIYIESMRLCGQLRRARPLIDIYESQCKSSFHTSDAPAQHLSNKVDSRKQFLEYQGAMPLGPKHFMVIRKNEQTSAKIVLHAASQFLVDQINRTFVRNNSGSEVYASNRASLLNLT